MNREICTLHLAGNMLIDKGPYLYNVRTWWGGGGIYGEVTFGKEFSYNYSYFWMRNLGTLVTSVTTIKIWLKK